MGREVADSFLRLYMMPGLQHCYGGPGAHDCGGMSASTGDPQRDFSAALERWVEEGVAPGTMIAVKPADPASPVAASKPGGPALTRPLCPFPQEAVFEGSGSADDVAAYRCQTP